MQKETGFDAIAGAWCELQREYWDALSGLNAGDPIPDCDEALRRQILLFRRLGAAIIKLRAACLQAGLQGLGEGPAELQLSHAQLDRIRENTESWIMNEQRVLAGWVDAATSLCLGSECKDPSDGADGPFHGTRCASDRLLDLQSICIEALRAADHGVAAGESGPQSNQACRLPRGSKGD